MIFQNLIPINLELAVSQFQRILTTMGLEDLAAEVNRLQKLYKRVDSGGKLTDEDNDYIK